MSYDKSLTINLTYETRGYIGTSHHSEHTNLFLDADEAGTIEQYRINDFIKALKKSVNLFSSEKVRELHIYIAENRGYNETNLYLIHRDYTDRENGIYSLYDYTERNRTEVKKMSKDILLKSVRAAINNYIEAYQEEQSA